MPGSHSHESHSGSMHDHEHDHHHGHDHHDDGHGHHHHGHGHVHAPASFGKAFAIGLGLNVAFVVVEVVYGFLGDSMALLADAGHNLSDVLGLLVAWGAVVLGSRPPSNRFTYGLGNSTILAALFNSLVLVVAVGGISVEAIRRLIHPEPVAGITVMVVAAVGIVINGLTAYLFASGSKSDINIRATYLHMLTDAGTSFGVVVAGLLIALSGLRWIDPAVSLVIAAIIFWSTWGLLKESTTMSMAGVPAEIDIAEVRATLRQRPGVSDVHDLHVWPMSTTEIALTCHLLMPGGYPASGFLRETEEELHKRFGIGHSTFQIETDSEHQCRLAPADVV